MATWVWFIAVACLAVVAKIAVEIWQVIEWRAERKRSQAQLQKSAEQASAWSSAIARTTAETAAYAAKAAAEFSPTPSVETQLQTLRGMVRGVQSDVDDADQRIDKLGKELNARIDTVIDHRVRALEQQVAALNDTLRKHVDRPRSSDMADALGYTLQGAKTKEYQLAQLLALAIFGDAKREVDAGNPTIMERLSMLEALCRGFDKTIGAVDFKDNRTLAKRLDLLEEQRRVLCDRATALHEQVQELDKRQQSARDYTERQLGRVIELGNRFGDAADRITQPAKPSVTPTNPAGYDELRDLASRNLKVAVEAIEALADFTVVPERVTIDLSLQQAAAVEATAEASVERRTLSYFAMRDAMVDGLFRQARRAAWNSGAWCRYVGAGNFVWDEGPAKNLPVTLTQADCSNSDWIVRK